MARYHEVAGVPGLILLVQSPSHDHDQIATAISEWVTGEQSRLAALPFGQVKTQARRLADHLQAQARTAAGHMELAWAEALGLPYATLPEQCAALEQLTAERWLQVQRDWLDRPRRLHLLSRPV